MLTIADKNVKEYPILNAVFPILTTNHLTDGLYIRNRIGALIMFGVRAVNPTSPMRSGVTIGIGSPSAATPSTSRRF